MAQETLDLFTSRTSVTSWSAPREWPLGSAGGHFSSGAGVELTRRTG